MISAVDRPEVHDIIAEMRRVADEFSDRVLIGEIYLPFERLAAYYGKDLSGAHLPFNFSLIHAAWNAAAIAGLISDYEASLPPGGAGTPKYTTHRADESHTEARGASA